MESNSTWKIHIPKSSTSDVRWFILQRGSQLLGVKCHVAIGFQAFRYVSIGLSSVEGDKEEEEEEYLLTGMVAGAEKIVHQSCKSSNNFIFYAPDQITFVSICTSPSVIHWASHSIYHRSYSLHII